STQHHRPKPARGRRADNGTVQQLIHPEDAMTTTNPFPHGTERHEIWDMLVRRDIEAFVAGDWDATAPDFLADGFMGVDGGGKRNPDSWRLGFGSLDAYRDSWLEQSRDYLATMVDPSGALFAATTLRDIDISGNTAVAHKKFDGTALRKDGSRQVMDWQSL